MGANQSNNNESINNSIGSPTIVDPSKRHPITQILRRSAQQNGKGMAYMIDKDNGRSYNDFNTRVVNVASGLRRVCQLSPRGRVAIIALNSFYYLESMFAISYAGGIALPINYRLSVPEIIAVLEDAEVDIVIFDQEFGNAFGSQIVDKLPKSFKKFVFIGQETSVPEALAKSQYGVVSFESLATVSTGAPIEDALLSGDDVVALYYTGGTTGKPKGVMLTAGNILTNSLGHLGDLGFTEKTVYLHAAPMFHLADAQMIYIVTMAGGTHAFIPKFTPPDALQAIQDYKVSIAVLVPVLIQMCLSFPKVDSYDLSSLELIMYGASPITDSLLELAMKKIPKSKFFQGYGMTECSPAISMLRPENHTIGHPKMRTVGKPVPWCEVKIVDENGNEVPRGTAGEIIVRGPQTMKGYWRNPEATAQVLKDNWMHTGDGGVMDEEGFITLKDRIKDMIKTGGENVFSTEVENVLAQMEGVAMVAVIGTPSVELGELVTAVIVPKEEKYKENLGDIEYVRAFCKEKIAGYKAPRKIFLKDKLPISGPGKVLKHELRKEFWQKAEGGNIYGDDSKKSSYT